jgi:hypothetical protein
MHLSIEAFGRFLTEARVDTIHPVIDATETQVLVELCCHTHVIIACWLAASNFVSFDIETFKNVFLREPHVWINFLSAMGIAIKYPDNYEAII